MGRNCRYRVSGVTIDSDLTLPLLPRGKPGPVACSINHAPIARSAADAKWFHTWSYRRRPWLSIGRRTGEYLLRFDGMADFAVSADGRRITADPGDGLPRETLGHLLVDQVLPLALARQGRLVLHASAVHVGGVGTMAFAGMTGRGKSTLAAAMASAGAHVMTDDCLAIEPAAGSAIAHPGYPGLRLWPGAATALAAGPLARRVAHYSLKRRTPGGGLPFHGRRSALRVIFLLSPRATSGAPATFRSSRPAAALVRLVRFAYLLDTEDRRELSRVFDSLAAVVRAVPVVHLRVRHGHRRLEEVAEAVRRYGAALPRP